MGFGDFRVDSDEVPVVLEEEERGILPSFVHPVLLSIKNERFPSLGGIAKAAHAMDCPWMRTEPGMLAGFHGHWTGFRTGFSRNGTTTPMPTGTLKSLKRPLTKMFDCDDLW
jgi:hypothetical protein